MPTAASVISRAKQYYSSGRSVPPGYCLKIVRTIAGIGGGAKSASEAYWNAERAGRTHENANAPAGAVYYWTGGSAGYGHIAISAGNGYIYTTDYPQRGKIGLVKLSTLNSAWGNLNFRGWSDSVNGVKITGLGKVKSATEASVNTEIVKKSATKSSVKEDSVSKADMAAAFANAGYSKALLASVPELNKLYQQAIQQGWTSDRFQGAVKNSKWYRGHTSAQRRYDTIKANDPKTYAHNLSETESKLRTAANEMGVQVDSDDLSEMAKTVYRNGLLDAGEDPGVIRRLIAAQFQFGESTTKTTPGKTTTTTVGASEFEKLRQAIVGQESGGDYGALGTRTADGDRAYGKYQIMDFNIPSWTKKYLGRSMTPQEFLRDHAAQDKVAAGVLKSYYDKGGAAYAAAAWYAGEGGARAYLGGRNIKPKAGTVGPSVKGYVDSVLARMKKVKGTTTTTTTPGTSTTIQVEPPDYLPGDAGEAMNAIRDLAHNYGVAVSDKTLGKQIQDFLAGRNDIEGLESYYRAQAVAKYPQFSEQLKSGATLEDIAQPYVDQMAQTLEMDGNALDWSDQKVQQALNQKDAKTGMPTAMPLWSFQASLKKDPRWKQTNNARNDLLSAGRQVLSDMGLVS